MSNDEYDAMWADLVQEAYEQTGGADAFTEHKSKIDQLLYGAHA